jgi:hypothetical protein
VLSPDKKEYRYCNAILYTGICSMPLRFLLPLPESVSVSYGTGNLFYFFLRTINYNFLQVKCYFINIIRTVLSCNKPVFAISLKYCTGSSYTGTDM